MLSCGSEFWFKVRLGRVRVMNKDKVRFRPVMLNCMGKYCNGCQSALTVIRSSGAAVKSG